MRELVVKYLNKQMSRRSFVGNLTKAGITMTAAQGVLASVSSVSVAQTGPAPIPPAGAAAAAAVAGAAPAGGVGVGPVCATLTELTDASTPCAAVTVMPALVSVPTNLRRDISLFRYLTTSSRILVSL